MNIRAALDAIKRKPLVTNVIKLAGGTAVGQLLVVIATPIVTRLYSPEDMGVFGLFMSFVGFATVGVSLKYEFAIVDSQSESEAGNLLYLALLLAFPVSLLFAGVLWCLISAKILLFEALPEWCVVAMFMVLISTGVFMAFRCWFVRKAAFSDISISLVSQGACRAAVPVGLGLLGVGWVGMLAGEVLGRVVGIGRMAQKSWPSVKVAAYEFTLDRYRILARKYWKYPTVILPSSLVDSLAVALPLPIIASIYGVAAAGEYLLVNRLAGMPAGLISASVADVFHNHAFTATKENPAQLRPLLLAAIRNLTSAGFTIYIPVAIASPFLFTTIFGNQWTVASWVMAMFVPVPIIGLVVSPLSRLLLVTNRGELKLVADFANLIVPIVSFYGANALGYSFLTSMIVFVGMFVTANLLYLYLIWHATSAYSLPTSTNNRSNK